MSVILFPDGQLAIRDLVRRLLAARSDALASGVIVSTRLPEPGHGVPYVAVRQDGSTRDSRLNGQATIRVAVWHRDEGTGLALAGLIEALLLAHFVDEHVRVCAPGTGPAPTTDPDTKAPLAYFTVTARLRPTNL